MGDIQDIHSKNELDNINIEIYTQINEIFSKTKIIQKFTNSLNIAIELNLYVYKDKNLILSNFTAKIGNSITVKSKIIKKEKAEEKYTDIISSGNTGIYVTNDPFDKDRIIIHLGNIPPKEIVIFESEYIQFIESSKFYEFELFRKFPIFHGDSVYQFSQLKGKIQIKTQHKIIRIEKKILMKKLQILEEKYQNKEKTNYVIIYENEELPNYKLYSHKNIDYIPSSKIYFEIDTNKPSIYAQKTIFDNNIFNYIIQYKYKTKQNLDYVQFYPALFIFLVDQSGSMEGEPLEIVSKTLEFFLHSLPANSFYQIIGFGSNYIKYDLEPKEYTQENIDQTIKRIQNLKGNLGRTDIYTPLKYIFEFYETYDINLPKNLFLLTDGEIDDKKETIFYWYWKFL